MLPDHSVSGLEDDGLNKRQPAQERVSSTFSHGGPCFTKPKFLQTLRLLLRAVRSKVADVQTPSQWPVVGAYHHLLDG